MRVALARALGRFRDDVAAAALTGALESPTGGPQVVGALLTALAATRAPGAAATIRPHLGYESWCDFVRTHAVLALGSLRDAALLDEIVACSRSPWSTRVRSGAARALGRLGDEVESVRRACRERLVEILEEPGFRTHLAALDALGRLGDPAAIPALSRVHQSAPDGRVRRSAYEARARIQAGRTTEAGLKALRDRVDQLEADNRRLRDRIDRIEPTPEP